MSGQRATNKIEEKSVAICPRCTQTHEIISNNKLSNSSKAGNYSTYLREFEVQKLESICNIFNLYKKDGEPNYGGAIKIIIRNFRLSKAGIQNNTERCYSCHHRHCDHTVIGCKISSCLCTGYVKPEIIAR